MYYMSNNAMVIDDSMDSLCEFGCVPVRDAAAVQMIKYSK